jgi:hypothetical protein
LGRIVLSCLAGLVYMFTTGSVFRIHLRLSSFKSDLSFHAEECCAY